MTFKEYCQQLVPYTNKENSKLELVYYIGNLALKQKEQFCFSNYTDYNHHRLEMIYNLGTVLRSFTRAYLLEEIKYLDEWPNAADSHTITKSICSIAAFVGNLSDGISSYFFLKEISSIASKLNTTIENVALESSKVAYP